MSNLIDTVYCLSCRRPMPASERVCPECGADQNAVLATRPAPGSKPPPRGKPVPAKRTETVACPKCHTPVEPNHAMCHYCGRVIDDPGAQARFQAGNAPVYVGIGFVFVALSLLCMFTRWYWILGLCGVIFGRIAEAEDRQNGAAPRLVFCGFAVILFDFAVRWAIIFFFMDRVIKTMHGS